MSKKILRLGLGFLSHDRRHHRREVEIGRPASGRGVQRGSTEPSDSRIGRTRAKSSSLAPTKISRRPAETASTLPRTGASTTATPSGRLAAIDRTVSEPTVDMSIYIWPAPIALAKPAGVDQAASHRCTHLPQSQECDLGHGYLLYLNPGYRCLQRFGALLERPTFFIRHRGLQNVRNTRPPEHARHGERDAIRGVVGPNRNHPSLVA